jgi:ER-bound oxygenase mpaB/B'/Rubber oxygenase, catalytic domain
VLTPFLGGGAAVLLQVAHPLVACGVVQHSGYDRDLWRRLTGTLRALYLITFGDREEAEEAGAVVQAVHAHTCLPQKRSPPDLAAPAGPQREKEPAVRVSRVCPTGGLSCLDTIMS